tara:strand:+ start:104 stop:640 length:537 start_codon:yes stop_codon:yes gene_type:complete
MNIRPLLFLVCFLLTFQKAHSGALLKDVNHLLELTKLGEQFEYIANDQSQNIIRTYSSILNMSKSLTLPHELKQQIQKCYTEVYSWEKFSEGITEIFAKSFTHKEISILIDFYSNLGLPPRDITNFKALIKKAERVEEASIQYIYENSQSCVREDSKLINNFLNRKLISQQTKLRSHE